MINASPAIRFITFSFFFFKDLNVPPYTTKKACKNDPKVCFCSKWLTDLNCVFIYYTAIEFVYYFIYDTPKRGVSDDWLRSFCIPSNFMDCISSGIVTQRCRTEVVQTLGTLMWTHTQYPSSNSYNVVRARLVQTYPTLADDDPGYVSSDSNENFSLLYMWMSISCHRKAS